MNVIDNITTEFDQFLPGLESEFYNEIKNMYQVLGEKYDYKFMQISMKRDINHYNMRRILFSYIESSDGRWGRDVVFNLNEEKLTKRAKQYAKDQVNSFVNKLKSKLGDLDECEVTNIDFGSLTFTLQGKFNDHDVVVYQQIILKVSSKGTMFHQWPARIRVDGKAFSEKKFKELVEDEKENV